MISRLTAFQPGYLYGIVCSVVFTHELAKEEHGHLAALTTAVALVVGVLAWWAWLPLHVTAARAGTFFGEVITVDFLAAVFIGGLVGCAFSMFPLRFLAGSKVRAWRSDVWAALFGLAMFGVIDILLISHGRTAPKTSTPIVTTMVLFALFGGSSLAFRRHFARRAHSAAAITG